MDWLRTLCTTAAFATLVACAWPADGHATTLSVKATGPGTISVDPQGTLGRCPTKTGWCTLNYPAGTVVTLGASPSGPPSSLATWLGACTGAQPSCQLTLDAPKAVLARFSPLQLTVSSRSAGHVEVAGGTSCGTGCWAFPYGAVPTLTAAADADGAFGSWAGWCAGFGSTCRRPIFEPSDTTAYFGCAPGASECTGSDQGPIVRPAKIPIRVVGSGRVAVNGTICTTKRCDIAFRRKQTVFVTPVRGRFSHWGNACGGAGRCVFTAFRDWANRPPRVTAYFDG
jgi:hypothetical protein